MRTLAYLSILLLATASFAQQDRTVTMMSGGVQRSFDVHLPSAAPAQSLPVLFCYHGTGGTSAG
ncbi:MAG: hypothetical protein Q8896_14275, partial [Bacteroidota bacterium]|nr:hypothetical protein [Bacteroidota bacterium]